MHRKLAGGRILGAARKLVADPSFKEGKALDYVGYTLATGPFWGLFTEPPPVPRHHHGLWRLAKTRHGGGWGIWRKRDERSGENENQLCPFSLFTLCPRLLLCTALQCFSDPNHHISGQNKMALFLCLKLSSLKVLLACESGWNLNWPCLILKCKQHFILFSLHSRNEKTDQHPIIIVQKEDNGLQSRIFCNLFKIMRQQNNKTQHLNHKMWEEHCL